MKKATKKIFAPKPKAPKIPKHLEPKALAKASTEAKIDKWITEFLLIYPSPLRDEISKLIEDRARHWRLENEIAQLKNP